MNGVWKGIRKEMWGRYSYRILFLILCILTLVLWSLHQDIPQPLPFWTSGWGMGGGMYRYLSTKDLYPSHPEWVGANWERFHYSSSSPSSVSSSSPIKHKDLSKSDTMIHFPGETIRHEAPFDPHLMYLPPISSLPFQSSLDKDTILHVVSTAVSGRNTQLTIHLILQMIKSVSLSTHRHPVRFHIITDEEIKPFLMQDPWIKRLDMVYYPSNLQGEWKTLFAPGSCQRLFLHTLLPSSISRVIYIDADSLVLRDLSDLWAYFGEFDPLQKLAATRESEILDGYYLRHSDSRFPFPFPVGINAGILLLDLDRIRAETKIPIVEEWEQIRFHYQGLLHVGDQDILNIWASRHVPWVKLLPGEWNVREDSWYRMNRPGDLGILHGSRGRLDKTRNPAHWIAGLSNWVEHYPFLKNPWQFQYHTDPLRLPMIPQPS